MLFALSVFVIVLMLVMNDWAIRLHNKSKREEINFYNKVNEKFEEGHKTLDELIATMPEPKNGIPERVIYTKSDGTKSEAVFYGDTIIFKENELVYPVIDESLIDGEPDTDTIWDISLTPEVLDTMKGK